MKIFIEWEILSLNSINVVITLLLDWISLIFIGFVLFISSIVIFYRNNYIEGDPYISRFILLVLIFVFSIILLIISPNIISILLGWDGLGLISYLLVIYYQNFKSYSAGILTVLSNRLGDVAFLLSIAWILNYGSWNYIYYLNYMFSDFEGLIISLLIIFAAITKRAQIPFSSWLPAAIAAPTPVSSLVHSSTLVTAGVYLIIRFNSLLILTGLAKYLLLVGGITIFISGLGANYEFDLKKIIALSTLRQLGLIIRILSMGYPDLAFFHLLTHALFKALLFICAGVIIHNLSDCQDIRYIGGLVMFFPLTASCFMISNLALCGFPFLAGFYSKDLILEICLISDLNCLSFIFYFFSTGLTACYAFRLVYYVIRSSFNYIRCNGISDEGWDILKSMVFMVMMAVVGGAILSWVLFRVPSMICLPVLGKILALIVTLLGALFGYQVSILYYTSKLSSINMIFISSFLGRIWFIPYIRTSGVYIYPLRVGDYIVKGFDKGWCEYFGAQGFYSIFKTLTVLIQCYQNNFLKVYLMLFFTFLLVLLILFYLDSLYKA